MNKVLARDFTIMLLILISPFLFYIYMLFPEDKSIDILFLTIDSGPHEEVQYFIWLIGCKLLTLIILTIWFITSRLRARYAVALAITFEFFKLYNILRFNFGFDNFILHYLYCLIVAMPYILFLQWLSKRLGYQRQNIERDLNTEINNQIAELSKFNSKDFKLIKKDILALKKVKNEIPKQEYLKELIELRDKLTTH